jgi:IclR family transcriptional regulator, acetate operon repressor
VDHSSSSSSDEKDGPEARGGTERALILLKELAQHPDGATLHDLARRVDLPKSSVHRALGALVKSELAVHPAPGRYRLGSEFVRLAYGYQEERAESRIVEPCLRELADAFGETAHYAELAGREVVYIAKVSAPSQTVRMTSSIGGRNPAYCTGVGKALLASRIPDDVDVDDFLRSLGPLEARTPNTLVHPGALLMELRATAERGFALDDEENEVGVNCIAFPIFGASPKVASGAISVAALRHRMGIGELQRNADTIREIIHRHLGRVTR